MARLTAAQKARQNGIEMEDQEVQGKATRDDIRAAALWVATKTNRVPVLTGASAWGKTRMWQEVAQDLGADLITVLLHSHTPDEVKGFQMPGKNNELINQLPAWARQAKNSLLDGRKVVLLFDELNLARDEVKGVMLTFLRDRQINDEDFTKYGPNLMVVGAMNPGMLPATYLTRVCLFHMPVERKELLAISTGAMARLYAENVRLPFAGYEGDSAFNDSPPPPPEFGDKSALALINAIDDDPLSFYNMTPEARGLVISSVVPPETARLLTGQIMTMDPGMIAREPELHYETIKSMSVPEAMAHISQVMSSYASLPNGIREVAHAAALDAIYDNLDLIYTYYTSRDSGSPIAEGLSHIDPHEMIKALADRNLIKENGDRPPTGTIITRLDAYIAAGAITEDAKTVRG